MQYQSVVIDNGSGVIKGGFSGEQLPIVKLPSIIGYTRTGTVGMSSGSEYIGDEAEKMRC
jgi:actin-related protein